MKKLAFSCALFGLLFLLELGTGSRLYAQSVKEKTMDVEGRRINVKVLGGDIDVVSVKPYIKAKEGKKKGRLWLDVVVKNTAGEPQSYSVFGQGKTQSGGWLGGMTEVPRDGKLDPGKQTTAKVRTGYEGEEVPNEIRVEILPGQ